jgi:hypothetical protein
MDLYIARRVISRVASYVTARCLLHGFYAHVRTGGSDGYRWNRGLMVHTHVDTHKRGFYVHVRVPVAEPGIEISRVEHIKSKYYTSEKE